MSCDKSFGRQHCALKLKWAIIIASFIVATIALFVDKFSAWEYTCLVFGITGIGVVSDFGNYGIKKKFQNILEPGSEPEPQD